MKYYFYNRISTATQDHESQSHLVSEYLKRIGVTEYESVIEQCTGKKIHTDRLLGELVDRLCEGDVLVLSEMSRLGRDTTDTLNIVNNKLSPKGVILVIASTGVKVDCRHQSAMDKMYIVQSSLFSELEHDGIKQRSKEGLDNLKAKLARGETPISKRGNIVTKLGRAWSIEQQKKGGIKSAEANRTRIKENLVRIKIYQAIIHYREIDKKCTVQSIIDNIEIIYPADELRQLGIPPLTEGHICRVLKRGWY